MTVRPYLTNGRHALPRSLRVVVVVVALGLLTLPAGAAIDKADVQFTDSSVPYQTMTSAGPLNSIFLGNEASAQVYHTGDGTSGEVYPPGTIPGDFGTFFFIDGVLYAPNFANHGGTATGSIGTYTAFTNVSQSTVSGTGTSGDPYKVTTVADAGTTGIRLTQVDTYVVGQESFRTDLTVANQGSSSKNVLMYRAMDCYLGGSDYGYGFVTGTAVGCAKNANNSPPDRIEQLVPLSTDNKYYEASYSQVWAAIGTHLPLGNTCRCTENIDNGVAISWELTIPAGQQITRSHLTVFSPLGTLPLTVAKTADAPNAAAGATDGYTVTIHNPNAADVALTSITDTLPAGFTYVTGSTTGMFTVEPAVAGQTLTWTGVPPVPAGGNLQFHFSVHVASAAGTYLNQATADAGTYTVAGSGPTAPITIGGEEVEIPTLGGFGLLALGLLLAATGAWFVLKMRG